MTTLSQYKRPNMQKQVYSPQNLMLDHDIEAEAL